MNVVAINGSPRGAKGNTEVLVQAFLSGVRQAGGNTETIYLHEKTIRYCTGCFACWTQTPGVCIHTDDMPDLLLKVRSADVVVFASPLYGNMVTGQMKTFLDRTLPLSNPAIVKIGNEFVHPARYDDGIFRSVLISNAGFPETHHFESLKKTFETLSSGPRSELAGMICCAAGPALSMPGMQDATRWYLDAVTQAGREVVEQGRIAAETQAVLDRSLADHPQDYAGTINAHWQEHGVDLNSGEKPSPSPSGQNIPLTGSENLESVRDLVSRLPESFCADAAGSLRAVLQFEIPDEDPGAYYLAIENGTCRAFEGTHQAPTMTLHSSAQVWIDVCTGKEDGAAAFMAGKYRVSGDTSLLMRFGSLFSNT